jgi:hypothetical protein
MKLCIDCKYCIIGDSGTFECTHAENLSPVDGKPHSNCDTLRLMAVHGCTKRGYWFEPKENETTNPN